MSDLEGEVQKRVISFCKYLNEHVEKWRSALQDSTKVTSALSNQAEQLRHIEKVNLRNFEAFQENRDYYKFSIQNGIEDDIHSIKQIIERLNKSNQELNNKLTTLEKLTLELDWDAKNNLINGTPIQPPLARILGDGLEFWLYFKRSLQNINEKFKLMDVRNEKSMKEFEGAFGEVDLEDGTVTDLVAITQYVDNSKAIL